MTDTTKQIDRAAFEKAAGYAPHEYERNEAGEYVNDWMTHIWMGYQLAARATPVSPAQPDLPEGHVIAPHYRGYACLGTGNYLVNHSAAGEPAELVISVATEEQKAGRKVGDEQDNIPGEYIQPDIMCVRVRFENVAGLDVLENQLRYLRNVHFPSPAKPQSDLHSAGTIDTDELMELVCIWGVSSARERVAAAKAIRDWHSAGVAAANAKGHKAFTLAVEWQERAEKAETALAAAREQASVGAQVGGEAKLEDSEQYRMQMAAISTAAMGYWKDGDGIHPDYDTPALRDVANLYAKYAALYTAPVPAPATVPKKGARVVNGPHRSYDPQTGKTEWKDGAAPATVDRDAVLEEARTVVVDLGFVTDPSDDYMDGLNDGVACYRKAIYKLKGKAAPAAKPEAVAPVVQVFPERDQSKPAEQQGMFRKFDVCRTDGSDQPGGKHDGCRYFVLDLNHDQHAPPAMRAYAAACRATHPQLADDIEAEFGPQGVEAQKGQQ